MNKGASKDVAARRTVRVAEIGIRIVGINIQIMTSSKNRAKRRVTAVYGMRLVMAIQSCLIQLYRCPSWHVYQREQKGLWIVLIANTTKT